LRVEADHVGPGVLAQYFARECAESGYSPDELTVLTKGVDPFRLDVPARRQDAEWFARWFSRRIRGAPHLREVHYVLSSPPPIKRPNDELYRNNWPNWRWLLLSAAKAARWLGLVPWQRIIDNRSEDPTVNRPPRAGEAKAGSILTELTVPDETDVTPIARLEGFGADQESCLAVYTEKSSVKPALATTAGTYEINFYIGGGEAVDRRIWEMARDAYHDGRKLIVFAVTDCDPSGHNMPIAIARKLQAHAVLEFPGLEFEVVRAGLTPDQARALKLPDAPIKPTEARRHRWRDAMDVGQVELDAALALKRDEFVAAIEAEILLYFDETLAKKVRDAREDWEERAQAAIEEQTDADELAELQERYDNAREEIEDINRRLAEIAEGVTLPDPPDQPEPDMSEKESKRSPLIDSDWGFVTGSLRLKASKAYEEEDGDE
jgi:hypothetical protein